MRILLIFSCLLLITACAKEEKKADKFARNWTVVEATLADHNRNEVILSDEQKAVVYGSLELCLGTKYNLNQDGQFTKTARNETTTGKWDFTYDTLNIHCKDGIIERWVIEEVNDSGMVIKTVAQPVKFYLKMLGKKTE